MTTNLTQENNLILQSYYTFSLITELHNNSFLNSKYYDEMSFGAPYIKGELKKVGVDNQGCAMMALYSMLVLPKELVEKTYSAEYEKIREFLKNNTKNTITNYKSDSSKIDFVRHIRNAVSHVRVEFRPKDVVIFSDSNKRTQENFSTELPLKKLGDFIHQLQLVHIEYINDL